MHQPGRGHSEKSGEIFRIGRQVVEPIARQAVLLLDHLKLPAQTRDVADDGEVGLHVEDVLQEAAVDCRGVGSKLRQGFFEVRAKDVMALAAPAHADHGEPVREIPALPQMIQCRKQLPIGQVAVGSEDDGRERCRGGVTVEKELWRASASHSGTITVAVDMERSSSETGRN